MIHDVKCGGEEVSKHRALLLTMGGHREARTALCVLICLWSLRGVQSSSGCAGCLCSACRRVHQDVGCGEEKHSTRKALLLATRGDLKMRTA